MTVRTLLVAGTAVAVVAGLAVVVVPSAGAATARTRCSAGARTLSRYGDHVYPDTGNGGYRSVHTDVHMVYDAVANHFLKGNHVDLTQVATRCLSQFSLDFERNSVDATIGPDLAVSSVKVDGHEARYTFVRPTYPGDPKGPNDPDPRAHQAGQNATVGGPKHNPLPPACSPELAEDAKADAADGTMCRANKLVITPPKHLGAGKRFTVEIAYTGRPGVHRAGDGTTDGWFRSDEPKGDGGFVTTEPLGTEDWMPLNNHPSAKPTYDFYDTVTKGRTAVANGILTSRHYNAKSTLFASGSTSFHWHMASPVASYLVENSVGAFDLSSHVAPNGVRYYAVQASSLSKAQKAKNAAVIRKQQDITEFESQFNGPYPFRSAGVLVGRPKAAFEEEMEGMITFEGGVVDTDTLYHENMHQWWGDNVSEGNYDMTFFKEGLATLAEFLYAARTAGEAAGGTNTTSGSTAFEKSLSKQFAADYAKPALFTGTPSDPTAYSLFSGSSTYERPGDSYVALRQILGSNQFTRVLQWIQRHYGGASITEPQLKAAFTQYLPNHSRTCTSRLSQFLTQWWDTAYPHAGQQKPTITGSNFYSKDGSCS